MDYGEDRMTENSIGSRDAIVLPLQQGLALSSLIDETVHGELHTDGTNLADRTFSSEYGRDDDVFIPDFAAEYDYAILLPKKAMENGTYDQFCSTFGRFGFEVYPYEGVNETIVILVRAPIEVLRLYAEDIQYQMKLNPEVMAKMCAQGFPEHDIKPIAINQDAKVSKYSPYEHVYQRYSSRVPEELYWRPANSPYSHPFGVKERLRLLATLMEMKPKWGGENLKMRRYIANGKVLGYFPLHQPEELRALSKVWLHWKVMPWTQPFYAIKEYFGEKIGLYYLFMGHYTRWLIAPAVIGLGLQIYCWFHYTTIRQGFNSRAMPFFSAFICLWAITMLEFWKRKQARNALEWGTNDFETYETDRPDYRGSRVTSYINGEMILYFPPEERNKYVNQSSLVVVVLICVVIGIVASIYVIRQSFIDNGVDVADAQTYASAINALQIQLANYGYNLLATELTKRENHRTTTAYEDHLTTKVFAFQFINSYASFFYIAFIAYHIEENGCGPNGCMYSLGKNLLIIFATRLLSGNFVELMVPLCKGLYRRVVEQCCCCNWLMNWCCRSKDAQHVFSRPELEYAMAPFDTSAEVIADYTEVAIQFGYQALFVSALPASSFAALVSNIFEVKGDSWKMMNLFQRPVPVLCEDIGAFQGIYTIITICSVMSNAALMKFTLTVLNEYDQTTQWWIFYLFQVFMFLVMFALDKAIEDVPFDVDLQRQRANFLGGKLIDRLADEKAMDCPEDPPKISLQHYRHYGSTVDITKTGYRSNTGSRAGSKHPSFSEKPGTIRTSTIQTSTEIQDSIGTAQDILNDGENYLSRAGASVSGAVDTGLKAPLLSAGAISNPLAK